MTVTPLSRQLKALDRRQVKYRVLSEEESRSLLHRLATDFVDPQRREAFETNLARPGPKQAPIDYELILRPDRLVTLESTGMMLDWLTSGGARERCYRFDRHADLPALDIVVASMDPAWATSWPGLFVDFDGGRALAITLDNERFGCELKARSERKQRR